jgi:PIN domain nuclease of toxin-antitoxin system
LLDTHIWLWAAQEPNRLGLQTQSALRDGSNEIWLSPISTWEALLLHSKGRIHLGVDVAEWFAESTEGIFEAPLTHEIALATRKLSMHQDPTDRFLVATALVLDLTLVTADQKLLGLPMIRTLANH